MARQRLGSCLPPLMLAPVLALALLIIGPSAALANTITVGGGCTLVDAIAAANGDTAIGGCAAGSGADTILLASGSTHTLTAVHNTTDGPNGLPSVTTPVTIEGQGSGATIERGGGATPAFRLLHVAAAGTLTLRKVTLSNGRIETYGGGILSRGTVTLDAATLRDNFADSTTEVGNGGGLAALAGQVTVTGSTFLVNHARGTEGRGGGLYLRDVTASVIGSTFNDNEAGRFALTPGPGQGGGIWAQSVPLTITATTVVDNGATFEGGGLYVANPAAGGPLALALTGSTVLRNGATADGGGLTVRGNIAATLTNSTLGGNQVFGTTGPTAGGIFAAGGPSLTLVNVTVADNRAGSPDGAGGIGLDGSPGPTLRLANSIVAGNRRQGSTATDTSDCKADTGTLTSDGHNLVGQGAGCPSGGTGDLTVAPADVFSTVLDPIGSNGGPTQTFALKAGSPAVDAGNPAAPLDGAGGRCAATDQRGTARPQGPRCDIGAYESGGGGGGPSADLALTLTADRQQAPAGGEITLTATIRNDGPDDTTGVAVGVTLTSGLTFVSATPAAGTGYDGATGVWTVGNLANAASRQLTLVVRMGSTPQTATARINASGRPDPDPSDNQATVQLNPPGIVVDATCTLIHAIIAANTDAPAGGCPAGSGADTIFLQVGSTHTLTTPHETATDPGPNGLPAITSDITIVGNGAIIQRSAPDSVPFRIFYVPSGGALTLRNLTVRNGRTATSFGVGGGIWARGAGARLALEGAQIVDNTAAVQGGGIANGSGVVGGVVTLTNTTVSGNSAGVAGGGIASFGGSLTLTGSTVRDNRTTTPSFSLGGGIYADATLSMTGGAISNNRAPNGAQVAHGAGLFNVGRATLTGVTISGNQATGGAGGIDNRGVLTLTDSAVSGNTGGLGGGIRNLFQNFLGAAGELRLENTTVSGNTATDASHGGGGILSYGPATLTNSTIENNTAAGAGGGILLSANNDLSSIRETRFTMIGGVIRDNTANGTWGSVGGGGGLANGSDDNNPPGSASLSGVALSGNKAPNGDGGGIFTRGAVGVSGGEIRANSALSGGGIAAGSGGRPGGAVTLTNVSISGNVVPVLGGGISLLNGGSLDATGGTIHGNQAQAGGGIFSASMSTVKLNGAAVVKNTATDSGGGIVVTGAAARLTIENSAIQDNQAPNGNGGGLLLDPNSATEVIGSTISGNTAGGSGGGGGIHVARGATLTVTDSTVRDNKAPKGDGGGIRAVGALSTTIAGSTIAGNSASLAGGIDVSGAGATGTTASISGSTISGNRASFVGGVRAEPNTVVTLANSTVSGNSSPTGGGAFGTGAELHLISSTVTDNTGGTAAIDTDGPVSLGNTILAGNRRPDGTPADCLIHPGGSLTSRGHNLVGQGTSCPSDGAGDLTVTPAAVFTTVLGPLADNGGPTRTHALLDGSPALNAGDDAVCAAAPVAGKDQRGVDRPQGATCDIGAVEADGGIALASSITIVVEAQPNDAQAFAFTMAGQPGFSLSDGGAQPASKSFGGLPAGQYTVTQAAAPNWVLTNVDCTDADSATDPAARSATVALAAGERVTCTFSNARSTQTGSVGGVAFADANLSGLREAGEAGRGAVVVYADANGNGRREAAEPRATTAADGGYTLSGLALGRRRVCVELPPSLVATGPRCTTAVVAAGQTTPNVNFGVRPRVPACTNGTVVSTVVSLARPGSADYYRPNQLRRAGTPGPWPNTRLDARPSAAGPLTYVQRNETIVTAVTLSGLSFAAHRNAVLEVTLPAGLALVEVVAPNGVAAGNLGRGPTLPSPLPNRFSVFNQNGRLLIFGIPPDGRGGYVDVYVVVRVNAAKGILTSQARVAAKVVGNALVPISPYCWDSARLAVFALPPAQTGPVGAPPKVDDVPDRPGNRNPY